MSEFNINLPAANDRQGIEVKPAVARRILVRAFGIGRLSFSPNFDRGSGGTAFSTVDAEMLIRHGTITFEGHDKELDSLVYRVSDKVDGRVWELLVALDCEEDYWDSPWATLMSARLRGDKKRKSERRKQQ